jgi:hypothetical protein
MCSTSVAACPTILTRSPSSSPRAELVAPGDMLAKSSAPQKAVHRTEGEPQGGNPAQHAALDPLKTSRQLRKVRDGSA